MQFLSLPILIFSPIVVGLLFFTGIFKGHQVRIRRFAKGFQSLHFIYALMFLVFFQNGSDIANYSEITVFGTQWLQVFGVKAAFGIDSLALVMILLTSFISLLALIASKNVIRVKHSFYYSMIMLLQTSILGVFCARDMFLFFLFWELELIPMYFLIGQWGDKKAKSSAMKFVLYTFLGSLFMLLGILLLHTYFFSITGVQTCDFTELILDKSTFPIGLQLLISILLLIGFSVKVPIVPLHTWLPDAHVDAPTPVSMLLASILLKMGIFGIFRFNIGILPDAFVIIAPYLVFFAVINILYTAFIAYAQTDIKKLIAYSSISNMGIILLGVCSLTLTGFIGATYHMIAHGIISAGLFMVVGIIYLRTKTRELSQLGGLGEKMPNLMALSTIIVLAGAGVPFLMGFVGEFLSFFGGFTSSLNIQILTIFGLSILIFSLIYLLKFFHKIFFGNIIERWENIRDITTHEFIILFSIAITVIFFGIFPMAIINLVEPIMTTLLGYIRL